MNVTRLSVLVEMAEMPPLVETSRWNQLLVRCRWVRSGNKRCRRLCCHEGIKITIAVEISKHRME